jgi:hypothetical protein
MTSGSPPPRRSHPASGGAPPRRRAPRSLSCRRYRSWASGSRSCRAWPRCMPTRSSSRCAASLPCATRALCSASSCRAPRTRRPSAGAQPAPRRWSRQPALAAGAAGMRGPNTLHTRGTRTHARLRRARGAQVRERQRAQAAHPQPGVPIEAAALAVGHEHARAPGWAGLEARACGCFAHAYSAVSSPCAGVHDH